MTDLQSRLLNRLRERGNGWGERCGVSPLELRRSLGVSDLELATEVYQLGDLGLVAWDGKATTAFNDPISLSGYYLTNVYLTQKGWEVSAKSN